MLVWLFHVAFLNCHATGLVVATSRPLGDARDPPLFDVLSFFSLITLTSSFNRLTETETETNSSSSSSSSMIDWSLPLLWSFKSELWSSLMLAHARASKSFCLIDSNELYSVQCTLFQCCWDWDCCLNGCGVSSSSSNTEVALFDSGQFSPSSTSNGYTWLFCSHECLFVLICSVSVVNSVAPTWQTFHSEQSVSDSCLSIFPWTPFAQLTAFLVTKCQIISYKRQVLLDVLLVLCPVLALNLELPSFCS